MMGTPRWAQREDPFLGLVVSNRASLRRRARGEACVPRERETLGANRAHR